VVNSLESLNPITSSVPDCAIPLLISGDHKEFPFGFSGSGILASYGSRIFVISAEHCFGSTPKAVKESINHLCIPISTSSNELIPLRQWGSAVALDNAHKELLPNGKLDIVVITIDQTDAKMVDMLSKRCIRLSGEGKWLEHLEKTLKEESLSETKNILVEARGYPFEGTTSGIDVENRHITTQGVTFRGLITWNKMFPHTLEIAIKPNDCPVADLNGASGGPVFLPMRKDSGYQYALAGMMIRASQLKGHFITIRWLVEAVIRALD